jgi:hypothetical protein
MISYSNNFPSYIKLEDSSPCSQEPTTEPYLEPDESSPHFLTVYLYDGGTR